MLTENSTPEKALSGSMQSCVVSALWCMFMDFEAVHFWPQNYSGIFMGIVEQDVVPHCQGLVF